MITWSLTTLPASGPRTVTGLARDHAAAQQAVIAAAADAVRNAAPDSRPAYQLHVAGNLVALAATGDDEDGHPDHAAVAALLKRLTTASTPDMETHAETNFPVGSAPANYTS